MSTPSPQHSSSFSALLIMAIMGAALFFLLTFQASTSRNEIRAEAASISDSRWNRIKNLATNEEQLFLFKHFERTCKSPHTYPGYEEVPLSRERACISEKIGEARLQAFALRYDPTDLQNLEAMLLSALDGDDKLNDPPGVQNDETVYCYSPSQKDPKASPGPQSPWWTDGDSPLVALLSEIRAIPSDR